MQKPSTQSTPRHRSQAAVSNTAAEQAINPIDDTLDYLRTYAREKPEMAALWCFGVGFVLGWKLKPW